MFKHNKLVLATHNPGKILELTQLFASVDVTIGSAADYGLLEPAETGDSFAENAEIKARFVAKATKLHALADDSGLVVEALGGEPGVYSADWAIDVTGKRDFKMAMQKLEEALQKAGAVEMEQRKASFVTVLCLASPSGEVQFFEGKVEGHIVYPPRGEAGFGYDPVFQPLSYDKTFAEMRPDEKHGWLRGKKEALSHRARAFKCFFEQLNLSRNI